MPTAWDRVTVRAGALGGGGVGGGSAHPRRPQPAANGVMFLPSMVVASPAGWGGELSSPLPPPLLLPLQSLLPLLSLRSSLSLLSLRLSLSLLPTRPCHGQVGCVNSVLSPLPALAACSGRWVPVGTHKKGRKPWYW